MKIKSMTATFGALRRARLEPGPGLTLIQAPNEGGKSTWAAFWRAMLYGIDTRERDRTGHLADKNRYQPWSGAPMEGEVTLELEGRDIVIRRGPRGNVPFGSFSAVYAGTQEPVPGLTASNCGELLAGVGQEVFTRSAFLGAGNMAVTAAPELERRIAALVSSGEEDVSFSQALDRLKEWRNRRQVNRSVGEIPKLEGELAQVREALGRLEETAAQTTRLEGELAGQERLRAELEGEREAHRAIARQRLASRRAQTEEDCRTAQDQLSALERDWSRFGPIPDREALKQAQGDLQYIKVLDDEIKQGSAALEESEKRAVQAGAAARDEHFPDMTGEEAVLKASGDCAGYQKAKASAAGFKVRMWLILLISAVAFAILLAIDMAQFKALGPNTVKGAILLAFAACMCGWVAIKGRKANKQAGEILSQYGVQTPEELTALAEDYRGRYQGAEKAAHEVEVIRKAVAERRDKRDTTKASLLDFVHQFAPEVKDLFGCSAALSRALGMDHELALARERASASRRRLEDLPAQEGGQEEGEAAELPAPQRSPEETERALARTEERLAQVSARLNQARGSLQAMGDPAALSARREELEGELARKRLELEALSLAAEALTQANSRLQERFSPALNALAGEHMARLTGDRYQAVSLTRELEGFVRTAEDVLPRGVLSLSRGTADQLYLAVRLAVCRLCLPEKPPIFLDDALTAFDDQRLERALELLWELSGEQQILLFTCQRRELEALGSMPGVKKIEWQGTAP